MRIPFAFIFIRETCISLFGKCLVEQSRLLAEGLIPRSLGRNLGPGLVLGFISVIIFFPIVLCAQPNLLLHNMDFAPQRLYFNPAFQTKNKVYVSIPMLSSVYLGFSNSGFKYKDLVRKRDDDSLYIDPDNMISKLGTANFLSADLQLDLLSFGLKTGKSYWGFNATEKISAALTYPKSFMELLWKGNGAFVGEAVDLNFGVDFMHYREYGLLYNQQINEKFFLGGRFKFLNGMENFSIKKGSMSFHTDPNNFGITVKPQFIINSCGFDSATMSDMSFGNYFFHRKNSGWGIDIGGLYKLNDKLSFSASLIDLGYIKWKTSPRNFQSSTSSGFTYKGIDLLEFVSDSTDLGESIGKVMDSLFQAFSIDTTFNASTTKLPSQVYLQGSYHFSERNNLSLLFYGRFFNSHLQPAAAVSFQFKTAKNINATVSYAMAARSYTNIGFGFTNKMGPVLLFLGTDNVLGLIYPQSSRLFNVRFGFTLAFGKVETAPSHEKDRDQDGVPDKEDDCAEMAGTKELNGCPDTDEDGIADHMDDCLLLKGSLLARGCPDKDNDSIKDFDDKCPDLFGTRRNDGCPDTDEDGVIDIKDKCADTPAGIKVDENGCPYPEPKPIELTPQEQFIEKIKAPVETPQTEPVKTTPEPVPTPAPAPTPTPTPVPQHIVPEKEVIPEVQKNNILFRVQFGVFANEPPEIIKSLSGLQKESTGKGTYRYTSGNFITYEEARDYKNWVDKKGITGAFIIAFNNGERIPVKEAIELQKK